MAVFNELFKNTFWPSNTEDKLYINTTHYTKTMQDIMDEINEHFGPGINLSELEISADHIQTNSIGCDRYDSSDYNDFLAIIYKKEK